MAGWFVWRYVDNEIRKDNLDCHLGPWCLRLVDRRCVRTTRRWVSKQFESILQQPFLELHSKVHSKSCVDLGESHAKHLLNLQHVRTDPKGRSQGVRSAGLWQSKGSGTCYSTRLEATNAFQVKHGGQYTSRYRNEPTARPDHIPRTTLVGGATYDIHYDSRYGGYGYRGPSRSWVMYDAFADAVMLEMLMSRHHYYYGHPYGHSMRRSTNLVWLGILCMAVIFVLAIYFHVKE